MKFKKESRRRNLPFAIEIPDWQKLKTALFRHHHHLFHKYFGNWQPSTSVDPLYKYQRNRKNEFNRSRIRTGKRQTSWLFTSEARDLNSNPWSERDSNSGSPEFKSGGLTTPPRCPLFWISLAYMDCCKVC